ncbi:tetratricopeptide repeat protein [Geomonas subterranea]|uniref:Tetratricopeptide repeat protein n=1 Tax=Geomonas subterranea TaxID=2847989 RepID=A0ABX8LHZ9_9BACT|nr:tetratricopeptide repeat protein [Geomonas subterranea]QXE90372.1 tetratricopeptide repeat protein [Geomonas subterranea]QXM07500.1 tetratricopeptide repeat protein [Geomonas subterranea]
MSQLVTRPSGAIAVMENGPLVSAIVVTRDREAHLRECLGELMEQTVASRMEVIVVDAGSTQCEWAVVADLQQRYANLAALKLPSGAAARGINMALKMASGKYLTILDATDRLKRDAYEQLTAALEQDSAAMVAYGDTCFTAIAHESFANHTSYGKVIWPDYTPQQLSQLSEVAPHPLWRREVHDSVGYLPEGYPSHGLREFLLKVVQRFRIQHIAEFTGLKLIAAVPQSAPQQAPQPVEVRSTPTAAAQPATSPLQSEPVTAPLQSEPAPMPVTEPLPAAGAEDAYAALRPQLSGDDLEQAAAALRQHLASYPGHAVAHNDLAAVSYQLGYTDQALLHYREAVALEPDEDVYLKNLADLLYVDMGQTDEAINIYLKLLERSPRDVETLLNLGIICEGVGQPEAAESFLQRALEIEPANMAVRERLSELRQNASAPAAPATAATATTPAAAAEEEDDLTAEDHYLKSQELVNRGDLAGAEQKLQGIVALYPEFAPAYNDLAVLAYQKGDKDTARRNYEKAAALAPGNNTFQKNLADFYFVEGYDVDGAINIYLDQLRKEPLNIETLMSLGKICAILDRPEEAETFYGKVIHLEPWNRDARECLDTLKQAANS